jgi:transcriptional regulator with XRE-family HTH domain
MTEIELKETITTNLIKYRKVNNYTQAALAEKINYSDKAISKWERGESIPDLYTLILLANLYGITLNDLTTKEVKVKRKAKRRAQKNAIITILTVIIVWLVACLTYIIPLLFKDIPNLWIVFVIALPVSFIVLLVFSALWGNKKTNFTCITGLILTIILSVALPLSVCLSIHKAWLLFILFAPLELMNIFWFILRK